jgi:hypothetical protein
MKWLTLSNTKQISSRSVRFIRKSPKLSISFDFFPPFIDYFDEAYELIQSNLNIKFNQIFNFILLTILKFQLKKAVKGDLSGQLTDKGYKRLELIGESGELKTWKNSKILLLECMIFAPKSKRILYELRTLKRLFKCESLFETQSTKYVSQHLSLRVIWKSLQQ